MFCCTTVSAMISLWKMLGIFPQLKLADWLVKIIFFSPNITMNYSIYKKTVSRASLSKSKNIKI